MIWGDSVPGKCVFGYRCPAGWSLQVLDIDKIVMAYQEISDGNILQGNGIVEAVEGLVTGAGAGIINAHPQLRNVFAFPFHAFILLVNSPHQFRMIAFPEKYDQSGVATVFSSCKRFFRLAKMPVKPGQFVVEFFPSQSCSFTGRRSFL